MSPSITKHNKLVTQYCHDSFHQKSYQPYVSSFLQFVFTMLSVHQNPFSVFFQGTHYLRGVNNNLQPWGTSVGRKQYGLKPANPTEEGLASLHSVLLRKQPYLWRAALLYYTVYHAANMSFSQLFGHIARFVQDPAVRWEYCLRAKRGQMDTSQPGEHKWTHTQHV